MGLLSKLWEKRHELYALPSTIYFNFRNLPFHQAKKLPIILYHAKILGKGKYRIEGEVRTGMIQLGYPYVSIFKEKGIIVENKGLIVFKGKVSIGANSGISVGKTGVLTFNDKFSNSYGLKVVCYKKITFDYGVRIGWDTLVCDTDFHSMKTEDGKHHTKGYGEISLGKEVWVGSYCKLYKNTSVPDRCTVASNTLLNKKIECEPYSLIYSGGGIKIKYTGYYRDINDDKINYEGEEAGKLS